MKGKLTVIICIICVLAVGLMGKAYIDGANTNQVNTVNPMSEFKTIADLQNSVAFRFQVPSVVAEANNISMYNYMNTMVEIQSDELTFRAAEFIGDKADVSGDYNVYPTDITYIDGSETTEVRYRTNNTKTIINITSGGIAYSISFNSYLDEITAFDKLDIDLSSLKVKQKEEVENTQDKKEETDVKNNDNNVAENNTTDEELTFKLYKVDNTSISFMLPNITNEIKTVYADNQLAVMLGGKLVFVVEYTENKTNTEYNGYVVSRLDDNYILRYAVNNPFEKDTQIYEDYYTIIENMNTVIDTFNAN